MPRLLNGILAGIFLIAGTARAQQFVKAPNTRESVKASYAQEPIKAPAYKGVWMSPPDHIPTLVCPDGPLAGNGDIGIVYAGSPESQSIYLSKNDCWKSQPGYPDGGVRLPGGLQIRVDDLNGAAYHSEQAIEDGTVSAVFKKADLTYRLKAWVQATENLVIIELASEGRPCRIDLRLWPQTGDGSRTDSGLTKGVYWFERHFDSSVLDWPTHIAAGLKIIGAEGLSFVLKPSSKVRLVLRLTTNHDTDHYLEKTIDRLASLSSGSILPLRTAHLKWWRNFWAQSNIEIGDAFLEKYYYGSQYLLASCSRNKNFPPGLWGNSLTMDAGFNNWEGDYHTNYNFQAPWWGAYSSNHIALTDGYDGPVLDFIPRAKELARLLLGSKGVYYPVGIGPKGFCSSRFPLTEEKMMHYYHTGEYRIDSGYMFLGQKSDAVFLTVNMFMRFYCTYDKKYAEKIYPFLREVADFWEDYLRFENGRYVDYNDNFGEVGPWEGRDWQKGYGDINPTITLGLLRMFYKGMLDVSAFLHKDSDQREKWNDRLRHLSPIPTVNINGAIRIKACEGGTGSGSRMLPGMGRVMMQGLIFPSGISGVKTDPAFAEILRKEIDRWGKEPAGDANWDNLGNGFETYFPAAARVGYDPQIILDKLKERIKKTVLRNLWVTQSGGLTEDLSAIPACINEMLLQGYEGMIRVFPDWPADKDAAFRDLRTYGAFLVSAKKASGRVSYIKINSEQGRECILENPWKGEKVLVRSSLRPSRIFSGDSLVMATGIGEKLTLSPVPVSVGKQGPGAFVLLQSKDLTVRINRESGLPYGYLYKGAPIGGSDSGQALRVIICRLQPRAYATVTVTPAGIHAKADEADLLFTIPYQEQTAASFHLKYKLDGSSLVVTMEGVEEQKGFELIEASLPDLATVREEEGPGWLAHGLEGGGLVDLKHARSGHLPDHGYFGRIGFVIPMAIVGTGKAECVMEVSAFMDGTEIEVAGEERRRHARIGTIETYRVHGGRSYNMNDGDTAVAGNENTLNLLVGQIPRCRLDFTADLDGNGSVDWLDGAKLLARRMPSIPTTYYNDKFIYLVGGKYKPEKEPRTTFAQSGQLIRDIAMLTDYAPQVPLISGWVYDGQDTGYPSEDSVNGSLGGYDGLIRLMRESAKYNANVSLNTNYDDAYKSSPVFDTAFIARRPDGRIWKSRDWAGDTSYVVGMSKFMEPWGMHRIDYMMRHYPIHDALLIDAMSWFAIRNDWDPAHPASGYKNLVEGKYRIIDEFRSRGVHVMSEQLRYPYLGKLSVSADGAGGGSTPFGGQPIPFLPVVYRKSAIWGAGGFSPDDAKGNLFWNCRPMRWYTDTSNRNAIADYYYMTVLPFNKIHGRSIERYEGGIRSRIGLGKGYSIRIDWMNNDYSIEADGVEVAGHNATFCPVDKDRIACYARRTTDLKVTLPADWDASKIVARALFLDRREPVPLRVVGGKIYISVTGGRPVMIYRDETVADKKRMAP